MNHHHSCTALAQSSSSSSSSSEVEATVDALLEASRVALAQGSDATTRAQASAFLSSSMMLASGERQQGAVGAGGSCGGGTVVGWGECVAWWRRLLELSSLAQRQQLQQAAATDSMMLLFLQLLQKRMRKELSSPANNNNNSINVAGIDALQSELTQFCCAQQSYHSNPASPPPPNSAAVQSAAAAALAALLARRRPSRAVVGGGGGGEEEEENCLLQAVLLCRQGLLSSLQDSGNGNVNPYALAKLLGFLAVEARQVWCGAGSGAEGRGFQSNNNSYSNSPFQPQVVNSALDTIRQFIIIAASNLRNLQQQHHHRQQQWYQQQHWSGLLATTLETLRHWAEAVPIPLEELQPQQQQRPQQSPGLLDLLVELLSAAPPPPPPSFIEDERVVVEACQALTEAVLASSHGGVPVMTTLLLQSLPLKGFVASPLRRAVETADNDEATLALSVLASTLACGCVDDLVRQELPPALLAMLMEMQTCESSFKARRTTLDVWLAVQDIPVRERHPSWGVGLFRSLLPVLLRSLAFSDEYDEDEWIDYRSSVQDVLVSTYFLMRADFIQASTEACGDDWRVNEAALFCLSEVAREVCGRIRDKKSAVVVRQDRERTCHALLLLAQNLGQQQHQQQHPLLIKAVVRFFGSYASAWEIVFSNNSIGEKQTECQQSEACYRSIVRLIVFMQRTLTATVAPGSKIDDEASLSAVCARSILSVLLGCSETLLMPAQLQATFGMLQQLLRSVPATTSEPAVASIAQGCTRLVATITDDTIQQQCLTGLFQVALQGSDAALGGVLQNAHNHDVQLVAWRTLVLQLHALKEMICFASDGNAQNLVDILQQVWVLMEKIKQQNIFEDVDILERILAVYEQLLKSMPRLLEPQLSLVVKGAMDAFQRHKSPRSIGVMAQAVEEFGSSHADSFQELLNHVAVEVMVHVTQTPADEATELLEAFFELNQRFILFCPSALVGCSQFANVVALSVEWIGQGKGERKSTREALIFLAQLFGWRTLRLSAQSQSQLHAASQFLDERLLQHGGKIVCDSVATIVGGPQMLLSPCADLIYATVMPAAAWGIPEDPQSSVAHRWLEASFNDSVFLTMVVPILIGLVREGNVQKNKTKFKMLLSDFCKVHRGEMSPASLMAFARQAPY